MIKVNTTLPKKGFTLIELLVVIAIIGVLATFIVASFSSAQTRARDSRRKADLDAVKKALELAKGDSPGGYYPAAVSIATLQTPGYIKSIPVDPLPTQTYTYTGTNCSGPLGTCLDYSYRACLENATDPQRDTTDTCGGAGAPVSYTVIDP